MALKEKYIKESYYRGVPLLNLNSSLARERIREEKRATQKATNIQRLGADIFTFDTSVSTPRYEISSIEYLTRMLRRETIVKRQYEKVGKFTKEMDHTQPAKIANSAIHVKTEYAKGWLPFHSNRPLLLSKETGDDQRSRFFNIKEIYIIQHGVMRNARDYHEYFMKALGKI